MIAVRQQEKLIERIASLSELELDGLLREVAQHLRKNNLEHLINNSFQMEDYTEEIEKLEESLADAERENDEKEDKLREIENICDDVDYLEEFEEGAFDKLKSAIKKIKNEI